MNARMTPTEKLGIKRKHAEAQDEDIQHAGMESVRWTAESDTVEHPLIQERELTAIKQERIAANKMEVGKGKAAKIVADQIVGAKARRQHVAPCHAGAASSSSEGAAFEGGGVNRIGVGQPLALVGEGQEGGGEPAILGRARTLASGGASASIALFVSALSCF